MIQPVGGFLELQIPSINPGNGCLKFWGITSARQTWVNASSAFHALICAWIEQTNHGFVWLPAIICPSLASCVPHEKLRFYSLNDRWSPRVSTLDTQVNSNDLVLAVNYCGQPPDAEFLEWVKYRTDVYMVEDCAHCLFSGLPPWGDWQLFSPRKIIGVPDGGLLKAVSDKAKNFSIQSQQVFDVTDAWLLGALKPLLMRQQTNDPALLFSAHQILSNWESIELINEQQMSRLSWDILASTPVDELIQKRKINHQYLTDGLMKQGWVCESVKPNFAPFGLRLHINASMRTSLRQFLHAHHVFTVVHWPELPSSEVYFQEDHKLQASHLILPLDHRYQTDDMDRVICVMGKAATVGLWHPRIN